MCGHSVFSHLRFTHAISDLNEQPVSDSVDALLPQQRANAVGKEIGVLLAEISHSTMFGVKATFGTPIP